ncbi:MAG: IgGFc-binding protein, partial [Pseudomonadota bacterium]
MLRALPKTASRSYQSISILFVPATVTAAVSLSLVVGAAGCGPPTLRLDASQQPSVDGDDGHDEPDCVDGQKRCYDGRHQECRQAQYQDIESCGSRACLPDLGCVDCNPAYETICTDDELHECNADGTVGEVLEICNPGMCYNGECHDPCADAVERRSYIGCEYWPVDLDNAIDIAESCSSDTISVRLKACVPFVGNPILLCEFDDSCPTGYTCKETDICVREAQHSPFAVVVSNPDQTSSVEVTLSNMAGLSKTVTVAAGEVKALLPQSMGFSDQSLDYSGITDKAYRLTSARPIVAYQFNPLDNVGVFSNDASLLLPTHTFDREYLVLGWPTEGPKFRGYATIVASDPGTTKITVTPTANVYAGPGFSAMTAKIGKSFELRQFQTLTLQAQPGGDLSGTVITGDKPFGAFSGHEAVAIVETTAVCCADHLEDQLFPTSTWGKVFALARSQQRKSEPDRIRVIAQKPGTAVTVNGSSAECKTLERGTACAFNIKGDVEIRATEPILVAHYLLSIGSGDDNSGDPALSFAVPTEQFRTSYTFLVPDKYKSN